MTTAYLFVAVAVVVALAVTTTLSSPTAASVIGEGVQSIWCIFAIVYSSLVDIGFMCLCFVSVPSVERAASC